MTNIESGTFPPTHPIYTANLELVDIFFSHSLYPVCYDTTHGNPATTNTDNEGPALLLRGELDITCYKVIIWQMEMN